LLPNEKVYLLEGQWAIQIRCWYRKKFKTSKHKKKN